MTEKLHVEPMDTDDEGDADLMQHGGPGTPLHLLVHDPSTTAAQAPFLYLQMHTSAERIDVLQMAMRGGTWRWVRRRTSQCAPESSFTAHNDHTLTLARAGCSAPCHPNLSKMLRLCHACTESRMQRCSS